MIVDNMHRRTCMYSSGDDSADFEATTTKKKEKANKAIDRCCAKMHVKE